jgi:F0F1-type ATP synthase assembly protein I
MLWGQLAIKALISGALIAAASELARRNPGWGGLIASLPLVSTVAIIWLWRDTGDAARVADFALASSLYVLASLPAFSLLAVLLRKGYAFPTAMAAFLIAGWLGYALMQVAGRRWGWPV